MREAVVREHSNEGRGRRRWRIGLAALGLTAALAIAACGGDDSGISGTEEADIQTVPPGDVAGEVTISNWPLYVDPGKDGSIKEFAELTGLEVDYIEEINDNSEFFGKVQPGLAQGDSGGRDMFIVTDFMVAKMAELGYLQKLDKEALPTVEANLADSLKNPTFDPGRVYSIPWQSGMTGLVVRGDEAPGITKIEDLFDPKYKGKVTLLTEMRDTIPAVLRMQGKDPAEAPKEDWLAAVDFLQEQVDNGQIRRFTGNGYTRDLLKGDAFISLGWSGDAVQIAFDDPSIEFIMPEEGCELWSDNMVIPVGAPNPQAAQAFMEFAYDPEVQADIAEWVNYVTPVKGAKEALAARDPELTENQLIFPDEEFLEGCSQARSLDPEEEQEITEAFEGLLGG
jgi:spermidine/putrescine transport system substrate-binding protein